MFKKHTTTSAVANELDVAALQISEFVGNRRSEMRTRLMARHVLLSLGMNHLGLPLRSTEGPLSENIGKCEKLEVLYIYSNKLEGKRRSLACISGVGVCFSLIRRLIVPHFQQNVSRHRKDHFLVGLVARYFWIYLASQLILEYCYINCGFDRMASLHFVGKTEPSAVRGQTDTIKIENVTGEIGDFTNALISVCHAGLLQQ